eukprot:TRINITY_DN3113_c0_g1_i4.p8 TRINITY_DN3113_c0_g1~~TRINITY_DN3113_c0_g1_i4.p8  ORF type:complete len:102 (+),score=0.13 TRINITY_DN3113_c0_g1_i4:914-1219(+)
MSGLGHFPDQQGFGLNRQYCIYVKPMVLGLYFSIPKKLAKIKIHRFQSSQNKLLPRVARLAVLWGRKYYYVTFQQVVTNCNILAGCYQLFQSQEELVFLGL